ncbi:MAG: hypothetical protein WC595_00795 [Candidatus Nanoarchaeia archaeon]
MDSLKTRYGSIPFSELKIFDIPGYPKIPLSNYFDKLVNPQIDKKATNIRIELKNGNQIRISTLQLQSLNPSTLKTLQILSSPHIITYPKYLTPKLAYLVGYLYGDGGFKDIRKTYLCSGKYEYKMVVSDEFELQIKDRIQVLFSEIFNLNAPLRRERLLKGENLVYLNPTCKLVYIFLSRVFDFPEGAKTTLHIPRLIKSGPIQIQQWFLRGLMDSDGDVRATEAWTGKSTSSPRIKLKLADRVFLLEAQSLFRTAFEINFTGPYTDDYGGWYIQIGKGGVLKAHSCSLFYHPVKAWRLNRLKKILEMGREGLP